MQTILVCDDDKLIVNSIALHLQKEGYKVVKAYSGLEVLDIIEKQEIHLILLDVMMPGLDGLSTTLRIRQEKNIPIETLLAEFERLEDLEDDLTTVYLNGVYDGEKKVEDKIKAKIEEVKDGTFDAKIVLQSLLEKE